MLLFCFGLLLLHFSLLLPFGKFPLALLALVESENVRHDTAGDCFNLVLRNIGVVDQLFSSTQMYLRVSQRWFTDRDLWVAAGAAAL